MKLELKHLAPYLPYGLKVLVHGDFEMTMTYKRYIQPYDTESISIEGVLEDGYIRPILRPISDLFNSKYEYILDEFSEVSLEAFKVAFLSELRPFNAFDKINYTIATKLFENHFDVFGLIEQNLTIDINTL